MKTVRLREIGFLGCLMLSGLAVFGRATAAERLEYRGELKDQQDRAVTDGRYVFSFSIFDAEQGGVLLWTEVQPEVEVLGGQYKVLLGEQTPLELLGGRYWLETSVNGETLSPRSSVNVRGGTDCIVDGSLFVGQNVGVGTQAPTARLEVVGSVKATGFQGSGALLTGVGSAAIADGAIRNAEVNAEAAIAGTKISPNFGSQSVQTGGQGAFGTAPLFDSQLYSLTGLRNIAFRAQNTTQGGIGIYVVSNGSSAATALWSESSSGKAGFFVGNVQVGGTLSKTAGSFKIDHPLDPANKYLSHSFVESPDMMNLYSGNAILNAQGEATVALPEWFEALNRDFRYQLTAIGKPGPGLYIAQEIAGNQFRIAGGQSGMKVSWQVTGTRQDAYANAHRIPVEEDKPGKERGSFLHPELFGQPRERGLARVLQPDAQGGVQEAATETEARP